MLHRDSYVHAARETAQHAREKALQLRLERDLLLAELANRSLVPTRVHQLQERLKLNDAEQEELRRREEATASYQHVSGAFSGAVELQATMGMGTFEEVARMGMEAAQEASDEAGRLTDAQARLYYKTLSPKKQHRALSIQEEDDDDEEGEDDGDDSSIENKENRSSRAAALLRMTMTGATAAIGLTSTTNAMTVTAPPPNTALPQLLPGPSVDFHATLQQNAYQASQFFLQQQQQQQQQLLALSQMRLQQRNHLLASQKHQQGPLPRKVLPAPGSSDVPAATPAEEPPRTHPLFLAPPPPASTVVATVVPALPASKKSPVSVAAGGGGPSLPSLQASMFASEAASASPVKALQAGFVHSPPNYLQQAAGARQPGLSSLPLPLPPPLSAPLPPSQPKMMTAPLPSSAKLQVKKYENDDSEEDDDDDDEEEEEAVPMTALRAAAARSSTVMGPVTPSQLKLFSKTMLKATADAAASAALAAGKEEDDTLLLSSDTAAATLLPAMLAAQKAAAKAARKELRRQQRQQEQGEDNNVHSSGGSSSTSGAERRPKTKTRSKLPVNVLTLDEHAAATFLGTTRNTPNGANGNSKSQQPKRQQAEGEALTSVLIPMPPFLAGQSQQQHSQQQQAPRAMALIPGPQAAHYPSSSRAATVLSIPQSPAPLPPASVEPAQLLHAARPPPALQGGRPNQSLQQQRQGQSQGQGEGMVLVPVAQAAAGAAALAAGGAVAATKAIPSAAPASLPSPAAAGSQVDSPLHILSLLGDPSATAALNSAKAAGNSGLPAALAGISSTTSWGAQRNNQMAALIDAKFKELSKMTVAMGAPGIEDDDDL